MTTININITQVFIYTLVFSILWRIIYFYITFDESQREKRTYRKANIFLSCAWSILIIVIFYLLYHLVYDIFSNVHFTFTF